MANSYFHHVKITGIKTIVPENYIDIDDELEYFDNNPKKLARAKKMVGYGRRYYVDDNVTALDLAEVAANQLLGELNVNREEIDMVVFLSQSHDYTSPATACIAHGRLGLSKNCGAMDFALGCSGYAYSLWNVYCMIESRAVRKVLLLSGDTPTKTTDSANRSSAQVFGDSSSATLLEYSDEESPAYFSLGTDGTGWDVLISPASGRRLALRPDICGKIIEDSSGNKWSLEQGFMRGVDVFNFSRDVASKNILDTLDYAGLTKEDISLFCLHQANKQIIEAVTKVAGLPPEKTPSKTFSNFANNACNALPIALTDNLTSDIKGNILLCGFGVGLSWGSVVLNANSIHNAGISFYSTPEDHPTREELIEHWTQMFLSNQEGR